MMTLLEKVSLQASICRVLSRLFREFFWTKYTQSTPAIWGRGTDSVKAQYAGEGISRSTKQALQSPSPFSAAVGRRCPACSAARSPGWPRPHSCTHSQCHWLQTWGSEGMQETSSHMPVTMGREQTMSTINPSGCAEFLHCHQQHLEARCPSELPWKGLSLPESTLQLKEPHCIPNNPFINVCLASKAVFKPCKIIHSSPPSEKEVIHSVP